VRNPGREAAVLRQPGVINDPPLRLDLCRHPHSQPAPDGHVVPRRVGDEVLQPLLVAIRQPGRHRLDRLTPPLQQQAADVLLTLRTLITPMQRPIHLGRELDQRLTLHIQISRPDPVLLDSHPRHAGQVPCTRKNSCKQPPKSY